MDTVTVKNLINQYEFTTLQQTNMKLEEKLRMLELRQTVIQNKEIDILKSKVLTLESDLQTKQNEWCEEKQNLEKTIFQLKKSLMLEQEHQIKMQQLQEQHANELFSSFSSSNSNLFPLNRVSNTSEENKKSFSIQVPSSSGKNNCNSNNDNNNNNNIEIMRLMEKLQKQDSLITQQEKLLYEAKTKQLEDLKARKYLHNLVQELKGNIRVYCRVRPLVREVDGTSSDSIQLGYIRFLQEKHFALYCGIELDQHVPSNAGLQVKRHTFTFDRVFSPVDTQEVVFDEISQLVQSALDGYKVCIFAYGCTASGKTYTMEGNSLNKGMIQMSVEQIYKSSEAMVKFGGWKFQIIASFLEIYNESIHDLLSKRYYSTTLVNYNKYNNNNNNNNDKNNNKQSETIAKYEIRHDLERGLTTVTDLEYVEVKEPNEVYELLRIAAKNRSVGATNCNERSSRSHSVFQLRITGRHESSGQMSEGVLNLIDLAGSERLKESKATGDRLKETQHINSSLSHLGDVIAALGAKEKHIPFRNSKLTYLLQNCLGGDCKTLMFVNVSPSQDSLNESLLSLRFASKVNICHIGREANSVNNNININNNNANRRNSISPRHQK